MLENKKYFINYTLRFIKMNNEDLQHWYDCWLRITVSKQKRWLKIVLETSLNKFWNFFWRFRIFPVFQVRSSPGYVTSKNNKKTVGSLFYNSFVYSNFYGECFYKFFYLSKNNQLFHGRFKFWKSITLNDSYIDKKKIKRKSITSIFNTFK